MCFLITCHSTITYFIFYIGLMDWEKKIDLYRAMLRFSKDCFSQKIQRNVSNKWSWISENWERFLFITELYSKKSFSFYTGIEFWENLKDLHRVFFQKFTSLLSESSVSKTYSKELTANLEKIRHGFCREHG